jgi:pyruvate dehydrogenase E2 component (dihydrolipoamide acetyltransferase)
MPELLRMPGIAAGDEEVVLSGWPVATGAQFAAGDVIATVETAKANVDVEAPSAGVILRMLVPEGTTVQVGDPIALLGAEGEQVSDVDGALAGLGVGPAPTQAADAPAVDTPPTPAAGTAPASGGGEPPAPAAPGGPANGRVFASPLARKLAREAGIPFETLTGTGPHGRVVRADVEAAIADRATTEPEVQKAPAAPAAAPVDSGRSDLVPHSRLRRAIARRLTASKATVPHFYLRGSATVDALLALRADINAAGTAAKISVNDLVVKAVAAAHRAVPETNVVWTDDGMRRFDTVDIGVAVATDGGLVTPVVRGVDRLPVSQVAAATGDLADRARRGALRQDELEGGSATVTNLGMYGTEEFTAIINPPQSMILAVGAARREPVVTAGGDLAAATVLRVTLSVDHRAIDGALAARWMRAFLDLLEHPLRILV